MNSLANIGLDDSLEDEKDVIGGGGPLTSNVYLCTIEAAFLTQSDKGANGIVFHLKTDSGQTHRETVYFTSGTAKGCKNYYERDGERKPLPGWTTVRAMSLLTVGKEPAELTEEEKVISLYDFDTKQEVPTKVRMLTDLLNKQVKVGILQATENKRQEVNGKWVPVADTRTVSNIDKVFRASDDFTVHEILAQADSPTFLERWIEKKAGKVEDKTKPVGNGSAAGPAGGAPQQGTKVGMFT